MVIAAFKCLCLHMMIICGIIAGSAAIAWIIDGEVGAIELVETSVVKMKAPWIWTFGWGLASFIGTRGRRVPAALNGILESNETTTHAIARIDQSTSHRRAWRYTLPITLLGVFLTYIYGIPNTGFAYYLIFFGACSIYYVAAFLLFHFVETVLAFDAMAESLDQVEFKQVYSPLHVEALTTYLALTTMVGLVAIYAGFRGTITAGFLFQNEVWRVFLVVPLILFLPGTLFYNFYPRHVLRKAVQHKILKTMERIGAASTEDDARKLLLDLRESDAIHGQILPFLDYKSVPSYLLAIFFGISIAYNNDPAVKSFMKYIFDAGTP